MDKDSNPAFIPKQAVRHVENLRFETNDGDDGIAKNIKGTIQVSNETGGLTTLKCICAYFNEDKDVIYYKLASTNGLTSITAEYSLLTGNTGIILKDTNGVLNYDKTGYITGINEIDGMLFWSEWGNNPRYVNIERAKTYGTNGFDENDIKVIKRPPIQKLKASLQSSEDSNTKNNIEDIMIAFSYRYRNIDGQYSVIAPFTNFQFEPNPFNYDFSEQSNRSMLNKYDQVELTFFTGSKLVSEIQLIWKESESNEAWIIDDFNKEKLGYGDNQLKTFVFDNSKTKRALPKEVLRSFFDDVPLTGLAQTIIGGRLIYSNYLSYYYIIDLNDNPIEIDYAIELVTKDNVVISDGELVPSLNPKRTVKSNRDYEIGLVYGDDDGRITTILNSKTSTIYVPNSASVTENKLKVFLKSKAPKWASYFKFFIKQNMKGYDQLLPTIFYEDGLFRWIKLEQADKDKIEEGDYLIVKGDTNKIINGVVKTKVLEITEQERNFLEDDDETQLLQVPGLYYKVKPDGYTIRKGDLQTYSFVSYGFRTRNVTNNIQNNISYIETPVYYGEFGIGLDDLTVLGSYSGSEDIRYEIEIVNVGGTDTFSWKDGESGTLNDNGGAGIDITGGNQVLENGISINFGAVTGHDVTDKWIISAKSSTVVSNTNEGGSVGTNGRRAIVCYKSKPKSSEEISAGEIITIAYEDSQIEYEQIFTSSSNYAHLEEWFFGDNIVTQLTYPTDFDRIFFRRGNAVKNNPPETMEIDLNGDMIMVFLSEHTYDGGSEVRVNASMEISRYKSNRVIFETEPVRQPENEYFEIGKTYPIISNQYHSASTNFETNIPYISGDRSQSGSALEAEITLDWFNAFSYGNGVESYKIRDEFGKKGLSVGVRTLTNTKEEYKQIHREHDITWSDVYNKETNFNGLSSFNTSLINFITLDQNDGSVQKLHILNGNLLVLQEDAIGIIPYNKQIIQDVQGGQVVGIATNILDERSYRPYAQGKYGISKHPETFVQDGARNYFTDEQRGALIRLANDGITTIDENFMDHFFTNAMLANKSVKTVAGYDPVKKEYLLHLPSESKTLGFSEKSKGFPMFFTYEPDFILNANNRCFAWKNGIMYELNVNGIHNSFFGEQYPSKINFYFNDEPSVEKLWNTMSQESNIPWTANLKTELTSRTIEKDCFVKKEDFWYAEIMGNTNGNRESENVFGLGQFEIVNGEILTNRRPVSMSIGDSIVSANLTFAPNKITDLTADKIVLENNISTVSSFLMYEKNQNVDGTAIRGDILEVELTNDSTEEVKLRAVSVEVKKSFY